MTPSEQGFLIEKALNFNLSFQQFIKLTEISIDLHMWGLNGIKNYWEELEPKVKDNIPQIKKNIFCKISQVHEKFRGDFEVYN